MTSSAKNLWKSTTGSKRGQDERNSLKDDLLNCKVDNSNGMLKPDYIQVETAWEPKECQKRGLFLFRWGWGGEFGV